MSEIKKELKQRHKQFLMSFFSKEDQYEEKEVNGYWLIKHWDGHDEIWTVDLYTNESYRNYKNAGENYRLFQQKIQ